MGGVVVGGVVVGVLSTTRSTTAPERPTNSLVRAVASARTRRAPQSDASRTTLPVTGVAPKE